MLKNQRKLLSMKKQLLVIGFALLSTVSKASDFDGVNVQLGVGGSGSSSTVQGFTGMNSEMNYNNRSSQGNINGFVSAGYSIEVPQARGLNLAANVFYVIGNQNAGNGGNGAVFNDGFQNIYESFSSSRTLKNTYGISVEPGFNFTPNTLGYFKLAWVNSQQNMIATYTIGDGQSSFNQTRTVNGFGYGVGLKQMLTGNIYLAIDAIGVSYSSASYGGNGSIKSQPSQVMGFASVGYKF